MKKFNAVLLATLSLATLGAPRAEDCAALAGRVKKVAFENGAEVPATTKLTFKRLYDDCDKENTFLNKKLPIVRGKQMKCSTEKNNVARLVQFPDKTVLFDAKAAVDADGSPVSCKKNTAGEFDNCETWLTFDAQSSRQYVDAEVVPFVVVPTPMPGEDISFMNATGIGKGDLAVIVRGEKCAFGVVGDAGPYYRLGEVSVAAHAELGNPQCANKDKPCTKLIGNGDGIGIGKNVTYIIFPGTRPSPLTAENVVARSRAEAEKALLQFLMANEKK